MIVAFIATEIIIVNKECRMNKVKKNIEHNMEQFR